MVIVLGRGYHKMRCVVTLLYTVGKSSRVWVVLVRHQTVSLCQLQFYSFLVFLMVVQCSGCKRTDFRDRRGLSVHRAKCRALLLQSHVSVNQDHARFSLVAATKKRNTRKRVGGGGIAGFSDTPTSGHDESTVRDINTIRYLYLIIQSFIIRRSKLILGHHHSPQS